MLVQPNFTNEHKRTVREQGLFANTRNSYIKGGHGCRGYLAIRGVLPLAADMPPTRSASGGRAHRATYKRDRLG